MHDFESFSRLIHEAYPRLHDRAYLEQHPLLEVFGWAPPRGAERLHRTLIDALEWLRPLGPLGTAAVEWRRYRHLQLRYVEGATPEQIARQLQVSPRQARRDHAEALEEIARLLWKRLVPLGPAVATRTQPSRSPRGSSDEQDPLIAEIVKLATAEPASPCQVSEVIQGVLATVARLAREQDVRITSQAGPAERSIATNRTVLRQLLLSVISDLIVQHPSSDLSLEVLDRSDEIEVIIEIQRDKTVAASEPPLPTRWRIESLLSPNVAGLARRLAGSLGARFTIQEGASPGEIRLTLPATRQVTVLLIDDNPDVALLFRRYLGDTPYRLVQARSAERALRIAAEQQPAAIILDVLMPSHDGWEILQALRADPQTASIPVIICSVVPDHALAASLGVADFLSKPVTRAALLDVLARLHLGPVQAEPPGSSVPSDRSPRGASHPTG